MTAATNSIHTRSRKLHHHHPHDHPVLTGTTQVKASVTAMGPTPPPVSEKPTLENALTHANHMRIMAATRSFRSERRPFSAAATIVKRHNDEPPRMMVKLDVVWIPSVCVCVDFDIEKVPHDATTTIATYFTIYIYMYRMSCIYFCDRIRRICLCVCSGCFTDTATCTIVVYEISVRLERVRCKRLNWKKRSCCQCVFCFDGWFLDGKDFGMNGWWCDNEMLWCIDLALFSPVVRFLVYVSTGDLFFILSVFDWLSMYMHRVGHGFIVDGDNDNDGHGYCIIIVCNIHHETMSIYMDTYKHIGVPIYMYIYIYDFVSLSREVFLPKNIYIYIYMDLH